MKRFLVTIFLFLVTALFSAASAFAFQCDGKVVTVGDTKFDVLSKCGEPSHVDSWLENRVQRDFYRRIDPETGSGLERELEPEFYREPLFVEEYVTVEEWVYNFGSTRFIRYLRFENNRLIRIRIGDYGY